MNICKIEIDENDFVKIYSRASTASFSRVTYNQQNLSWLVVLRGKLNDSGTRKWTLHRHKSHIKIQKLIFKSRRVGKCDESNDEDKDSDKENDKHTDKNVKKLKNEKN